jgi:hypothetical protein
VGLVVGELGHPLIDQTMTKGASTTSGLATRGGNRMTRMESGMSSGALRKRLNQN